MAASWRNAPDLAEMARPIIEVHHGRLEGYPLRFVWRSEMRKVRGSFAVGTAEIVKGRFAAFVMTEEEQGMEGQEFGPAMFWIEIAEDAWEELSDSQRLALLDHELMHCDVIETDRGWEMSMKPHDIEEFNAIVQRHGLWHERLFDFGLTVTEAVSLDVG